jgi:hypothetical protein
MTNALHRSPAEPQKHAHSSAHTTARSIMQVTLTHFEAAFLQDLVSSKNSWLEAARTALEGRTDLAWSECPDAWRTLASLLTAGEQRASVLAAINELLSGLSHSFLATLDGATQLAETTLVEVRGDDAAPFKRFLHEFWPEYSANEA